MFRRSQRWALPAAFAGIFMVVGCSTADSDDDTVTPDPEKTLYEELGGEPAITAVVKDFLTRVVGDAAINGYFLNASANGSRLETCLIKQFGALTGGPQKYPAAGEAADADGCRNMKESHEGLGISDQDFADLAGHLVAALQGAGVPQTNIDKIVAAVTPLYDDIVEDADNDDTIYQRVGRKPAITAVTQAFVGAVLADPAINGYFLNSSVDGARLTTCLVRQICALTSGPCKYGEGVEAELGGEVCKDMTSSHAGMGISTNDFTDLANHLVAALTDAGVAQTDIDTIAAALTDPALVGMIVEDPNNDATVYQRVGRKPAISTVVGDFAGRVFGDPTINGFFNTSPEATARLATCLVRQVCSIDGPCRYGEGVEAELDGTPCRDMMSSHAGLMDDQGSPITIDDFNALVGHLIATLDEAGVAAADRDAVVGALGPTCGDIVDGGIGCN